MEMIKDNNQKRELLNEKNKKLYEDILVYVRLSYNKSEQETEEILMELLDHLLSLQKEDRDASELFGDNPRSYADEIIGELPKTVTRKSLCLFGMGVCYFFATFTFFQGFLTTLLSYIFDHIQTSRTYALGTVFVNSFSSVVIAALVVYGMIRYLRWSCFNTWSKAFEVIFTGVLFGIIPFGLFIALFYFMPAFGVVINLDVYWLMPIGIILFLIGQWLRKRA
ncbi:DUF1129 family protein [Amphibacillus cookii]|uniref:DUF1129 family protein n=1 Tax=Amphibacillus cookii TaxID=767787 RepID=UPI00195EDC46|nr:DUF1129 family protein [Amphibacillus cookii]MBM7541379.1 DNA-binding ferritin-like protein (Dps family) [Amphibacillus cookii]